jgi:WD40 repeat protein
VARLAVDAGTWSVAAMLAEHDGGRRLIVPDPVTGLPWSRSSVARDPEGGWLTGENAEGIRPLRAGLYRDDVKRLLDSAEPVYLDGAPYRPEELLAQVIWQRVTQAWTMTDESVDELVLGVPVSFDGARQDAVREAARLAGFRSDRVSLVLEPVAAAQAALHNLRASGTFLVFDLGGGTLDCSLVTAQDGTIQVIGSTGDAEVGGFRIDAAIVADLRARHSLPEPSGDPADDLADGDLLAAARAMKHHLSQNGTAYSRNPLPSGNRQLTLRRADLKRIVTPIMDDAIACCEILLEANSLNWKDLTATIATGGATRSTVIANRLRLVTSLIEPSQPPELLTVEGLLPLGDEPRIHARRLPAIRSIHTLSGPPAAFNAVAFSPDCRLVAAGSDDGSIRIWDTATGNPYGRPLAGPQGHTGKVLAVAFSPDGTLLASGGEDEKIRLWELPSTSLHGAPITSSVGQVSALAFTIFMGEPELAATGNKRKVELWDPVSAKMLKRLDSSPAGPLTSLAAWPERSGLVACGGTNANVSYNQVATEQLYLWESENLDFRNIEIGRTTHYTLYRDNVEVNWSSLYANGLHLDATGLLSLALSPDGATVATGSRSGEIRVWKLSETPETATILSGHREPVAGLAWNPNGSLLASVGAALRIWEPATRVSRILTDHTAGLTGVQFSSDGTLIATSSQDNTVRIWGID